MFGFLSWKQFLGLFRRSFDMDRWVRFLGCSFGSFALLFMLPGGLLSAGIAYMFAGPSVPGMIALGAELMYLYLICVWLNLRLWRWAKRERLL